MENKTLHIVCAIDDGFMLPLSTMIDSLCETNKENNIKVHLFSANLSENNVNFIKEFTHSHKQEFEFYRLDLELFKSYPVDERISYAAYYRLVVPEIINPEVERFLYLDADIIIQRNLKELFEIDLNGHVIAATHDIVAVRDKYYEHHDIPEKYKYFNSGVLLVDVEKWKENNATKTIREYLINNIKRCVFHDQDGLNGVLHTKRYVLPPEWNQQVGLYFLDYNLLSNMYGEELYLKALNTPAVIHYNGWEKPWHFLCGHPGKKLFLKHLEKTGLKLRYKDATIKNWLKMLRYKIFGWKKLSKKFYIPLDY